MRSASDLAFAQEVTIGTEMNWVIFGDVCLFIVKSNYEGLKP